MKQVLDLINNFKKDEQSIEFINNQFDETHSNKNVLFVSPQLNGRNFYKYIMPYILMYEYDVMGTAMIGMDKFKPNNEYDFTNIPLYSKQILWADYIIFPFSIQNLSPLYENIRYINPEVKIVYNVDFNFYLLGKSHPLHDKFNNEEVISILEDNIFFSDLCLTTNKNLSEYLSNKFSEELNETKYKDIESNVEIATLPILIDEPLIMENIEQVKNTPKETKNTSSDESLNESKKDSPEENVNVEDKLKIGIVASNYTWEDLNSYKEQFKELQDKFGDKITFYVIGYDGIDLKTKKSCFPSGFNFEYIKPCTIIHYYKQLKSLNLDLLFIPLRKIEFNETSENYNKFLESSLFNIPIIVSDVFPYNQIINDGDNGILMKNKKDLIIKIESFLNAKHDLKRIGSNACDFVKKHFLYNESTIGIFDNLLS